MLGFSKVPFFVCHSVYHTDLAWSRVLRGKLCVRDFRKVTNNTSNLRRALIFGLEKKMQKDVRLKIRSNSGNKGTTNYREKLQIPRKIPREVLSCIWQYWCNFRLLQTYSSFLV